MGQLSHNWYKKQGCPILVPYQSRSSYVPVPLLVYGTRTALVWNLYEKRTKER